MANNELSEAEVRAKLAINMLHTTRQLAQRRGILPPEWMLAIIDEMALTIVAHSDGSNGVSYELVTRLLTETIAEMRANPRIVESRNQPLSDMPMPVSFVVVMDDSEDETPEEAADDLVERIIGKRERSK